MDTKTTMPNTSGKHVDQLSQALTHHGHHQLPHLRSDPAIHAPDSYPPQSENIGSPLSSASDPPASGSTGSTCSTVLPLDSVHQPGTTQSYPTGMDTTGQIAPPGMSPWVTVTLWEDEGSLCFQVEARGICVARREDNHMINGTKLLKVAGITRDKRDGILKSERVRHVVKIGPVHLKGVWIPFERALEFANKEKITEMLYPLFVKDMRTLLHHPTNQTKRNQVMENSEGRLETPSESVPQISNSDAALLAGLRDSKLEPTKASSIGMMDGLSSTPGFLASIMHGQQHMDLTQMRLDSDSNLKGNSLSASRSGSLSSIGGPYHRMDRPYPQRSTFTPPPNGRSHLQRGHYLLTPSTSGSSASGAKTPEKDQQHKFEIGSDQYTDAQYYYASFDSGTDNVMYMPILPTASAANDQDEKSSPTQPSFFTPGPDSENLNEAITARSFRVRSTKTRSPTVKREVEVLEGYSSSDEKEYVGPQSPRTPQSHTIGMDNNEDTFEAPAERKYTHMQVSDLSPSQTSPQSDSERSSDSETGLLTGSERRSILLERLMSYFFELFSSCPSPVPVIKAENQNATPNLPSANISGPDSNQHYQQRRTHSSRDNHNNDGHSAVQVSVERDKEPETPEPLPLPYFASSTTTRDSMNRSAQTVKLLETDAGGPEFSKDMPSMLYPMPPVLPTGGRPSSETGHVRVVHSRPKPQCWEHGCNGRQFLTFSNLLRHQRQNSGQTTKALCPFCGAEFTSTFARDGHLLHGQCKSRSAQREEHTALPSISRPTARDNETTPPTLPPPGFLDQSTDAQHPWDVNYELEASFFNREDYSQSDGQDKIPRDSDGMDATEGQSNISASTEVSAKKRSDSSHQSTSSMQKRDRDEDDGEKDSNKQPDKRTRLSDNRSTAPKRLACPFFKKDPEHPRLGRSCSGPGWGTVHRIKEHLDRNHALPPSCVRCYTAFETDAERDTHMRLQDQCQLQERPGRMYGFDAFQKEQLRSRPKGYKHMSETQKWCHIYTILFPETAPADIPSPHYEFGSLRDSGHPIDPMTEYENFLRHEMPDRVRHQLELRIEEALNPLEETLRGQIVDIVRDVQLELFQTFRASAGPARPDSHSAQESAVIEVNDNSEEIRDRGRGNNDVSESTSLLIHSDAQSDWEEQMQPFRPVPPLDFSFTDFDGELFDFSSLINIPTAQDSTYGSLSMSQAGTDKDASIGNETTM